MLSANYKLKLNKQNDLTSKQIGKRAATIGFLSPDISNLLIAKLAQEVEEFALEYECNVVICNTDLNSEKEKSYISLLKQKNIDGFILAGGFRNREIISELLQEAIPVVSLSDAHPSLSINTVTVDNFMAGYELARHLISLGHRRIALIAEDNASSHDRISGYKEALQDYHLEVDEEMILISNSSKEHAQHLAEGLLDLSYPPTAILACNDVLAIGALLGAREKEVKIPEQLSVTGFDNTLLAKISNPPLTTIEVPTRSMSALAVDLLIKQIEKRSEGKQTILAMPKLILRNSTGICPLNVSDKKVLV